MRRLWKALLWTGGALVALAAITVFAIKIWISGFLLRTHDQSVMKAIKAEAQILAAGQPTETKDYWEVPKSRWPRTIASLEPAWVTVSLDHDVRIQITPFFDGGWGYDVPHSAHEPPGPECSEISQGVYWCHPY